MKETYKHGILRRYKVWKNGRLVETPCPGMYAGITTMKIFGRLTCRSGMRAKKEHRVFFYFWEDAVKAGFRPCKICKPEKFSRADCDHMPFAFPGGLLIVTQTNDGKMRVTCALCDEFLGYAEDNENRLRWDDGRGFIIPVEGFENYFTTISY